MSIYFAVVDGRPAFLIDGMEIPPGAVPLSVEEHSGLLAGQAMGREVAVGEDGRPILRDAELPPAQPPAPLTARQLRLWLLSRGISGAMVDTAIAALPAEHRDVAEIEWEYATQYLREHPLIDQIGAAFGLRLSDIDAAWIEAARL